MNKLAPQDEILLVRQRPADPQTRTQSMARSVRRWSHGQAVLAWLFLVLILVCALGGPSITPHDPLAIALSDSFSAPSLQHWLGTDQIGRDVLSRVIFATRVTLFIAVIVVLLAGGLGSLLGIVAGYFGGVADTVVMRLADIQLALPAVILALVLAGAIGPSLNSLILVLTLASWARFARIVRGEVLSLKMRDFVLSARLAGASGWWIMLRHITPNIVGTLVVLATLDLGTIVILEATLSFLGLGVQPPLVSWGGMIAEGRGFLNNAWWVCISPGIALIITVLTINILGDVLRDRLNPLIPETW